MEPVATTNSYRLDNSCKGDDICRAQKSNALLPEIYFPRHDYLKYIIMVLFCLGSYCTINFEIKPTICQLIDILFKTNITSAVTL